MQSVIRLVIMRRQRRRGRRAAAAAPRQRDAVFVGARVAHGAEVALKYSAFEKF